MKKYTFSTHRQDFFCNKSTMLFNIFEERCNFLKKSLNNNFNKKISKIIFKKQIIRNIEKENDFLREYGLFGENVLKMVPQSYSRDILNLFIIYFISSFIEVKPYILFLFFSLYVFVSLTNYIVKKQQIEYFLSTGIVRVQDIHGMFECSYKEVINNQCTNYQISEEEILIIKELLSSDSFDDFYNGENIIKYGGEKYLNLIYDLKREINKITKEDKRI